MRAFRFSEKKSRTNQTESANVRVRTSFIAKLVNTAPWRNKGLGIIMDDEDTSLSLSPCSPSLSLKRLNATVTMVPIRTTVYLVSFFINRRQTLRVNPGLTKKSLRTHSRLTTKLILIAISMGIVHLSLNVTVVNRRHIIICTWQSSFGFLTFLITPDLQPVDLCCLANL